MPRSRLTISLIASLAVSLMAIPISAQRPMKIPKEKISSAGEIKAIKEGVFHVKNIGGDEWFIRVEAMAKDIFLKGEADGSWLNAGMPVEFSGEFLTNRKGEPLGHARKAITKLKVETPRNDGQKRAKNPVAAAKPAGIKKEPARGSFLVGTNPNEAKPENAASFSVKGLLKSYKGGRMIVVTDPSIYTADLAPDAKIAVNISDLRFAQVGDEFEFEGWHIPGQQKFVHATSVWIKAATPMSGDTKTGRQLSASKEKAVSRKSSPTADQRRSIMELQRKIAAADEFYSSMEFQKMVDAVNEASATMDELASGQEFAVIRMLKPHYSRLKTLRTMLDMEGYRLPPLNEPNAGLR